MRKSTPQSSVEDRVRRLVLDSYAGERGRVSSLRSVAGGCISSAYAVTCSSGDQVFVKANQDDGALEMFQSERVGLDHMAKTRTLRVPVVRGVHSDASGAYLVMDMLPSLSSLRGSGAQREFGERLAAMHLTHRQSNRDHTAAGERTDQDDQSVVDGETHEGQYGFPVDNYIGSTPQCNPWTQTWTGFWTEHRLGAMLHHIKAKNGDADPVYMAGQQLLPRVREWLEDGTVVVPSLLHGDLWSGNVGVSDGVPCVYDPAAYYGHDEAEMGIMQMFGGFSSDMFVAYHAVIPKQGGKRPLRLIMYQLYHELNHYLLFGSGYRSSCLASISQLQRHK